MSTTEYETEAWYNRIVRQVGLAVIVGYLVSIFVFGLAGFLESQPGLRNRMRSSWTRIKDNTVATGNAVGNWVLWYATLELLLVNWRGGTEDIWNKIISGGTVTGIQAFREEPGVIFRRVVLACVGVALLSGVEIFQ